MKAHSNLVFTCLLITVLGSVEPLHAAPITFNTALPVAEDEYIFRQQLRWLRSDQDGGRDMRVAAAISVLGYGINSKLAVFGVLPYLDKRLLTAGSGSNSRRSNEALGDATAFARYTFHQNNARGRSFRLAGFAGFTAPTGDDDASDRFGVLPPPLQNGSGAWDGFGGMVATHQTLDYQFDGQLSYRANGNANGFEAGHETRLDLSWQHRIWPRELGAGVPGFLYAVLELNGLHQRKNLLNGQRDQNSGGTTVWASPGLQYVTRRWVLEMVLQKPVLQNLNGSALENELIFTTSFRVNF